MTAYVCPTRDIVCGDRPSQWCTTCPKRAVSTSGYVSTQAPSTSLEWDDSQADAPDLGPLPEADWYGYADTTLEDLSKQTAYFSEEKLRAERERVYSLGYARAVLLAEAGGTR